MQAGSLLFILAPHGRRKEKTVANCEVEQLRRKVFLSASVSSIVPGNPKSFCLLCHHMQVVGCSCWFCNMFLLVTEVAIYWWIMQICLYISCLSLCAISVKSPVVLDWISSHFICLCGSTRCCGIPFYYGWLFCNSTFAVLSSNWISQGKKYLCISIYLCTNINIYVHTHTHTVFSHLLGLREPWSWERGS